MFRDLKADEIEARVGTVGEKGVVLLLYKDARADMTILDETVGAMNWKREHTRDNANCIVSIWNDKINQWISKEDTGTESQTAKEKGQASDSFKRACTNWGIGRELYTSPFIFVACETVPLQPKGYKLKNKFQFNDIQVKNIEIQDKKIIALEITDKNNQRIYKLGSKTTPSATQTLKVNNYIGEAEREQLTSINIPTTKAKEIINSFNVATSKEIPKELFPKVLEAFQQALN